jgi:FO synthase
VPERVDSDVAAALRSAERDPAGCSDAQYFALATADGPALDAVAALADSLRKDAVGDDVTFVINRNINFTNICYTGCRFCAFAQRKGDADAFSLSTSEVADRAWEAHVAGATEVCMQGGIDPELPVTGYADLVRAVKAKVPSMHVHAFSPMEIASGATKSGMGIREWLIDGENGFLVPWKDSTAFAARVDQLLRDKPLARRLGAHGRALANSRFNFAAYVDGLEHLFTRAAHRPAVAA